MSSTSRLVTLLPTSPDLVDDDILKIVEEIQAGIRVEENCEKIYKRFRTRVRSFFLNKGFSPQESDDLTQDVFLRVFKSIDTFRRESRFERWLWEITGHIYSNEIRRRRTEKRDAPEQSLDAVTETEEGSAPALAIPSPGLSPEEEVVRSERSKALHAALKDLPDQMRRCYILRYEKGLRYQDIAFIMGISIEAVKGLLYPARKRLQLLLSELPSESNKKVQNHQGKAKASDTDIKESWRDLIEADLLQKIRERLPKDLENRYEVLAGKRDAESLTPAEYEELLRLSDKIEGLEVQRLEALVRLAKLREVSFDTLVKELSLQRTSNG